MAGLDAETLQHALTTARERGFKVVKLKHDGMQFRAVLGDVDALDDEFADSECPEAVASTPTEFTITAPVVGYFNASKVPLKAGQEIKEGDVVGQVSALGHFNDITAPQAGTITEILVSTGQAVMYGQPIAKATVKA